MTHRHDPRMRPRVPAILAVGAVIVLAACGGGGSGQTAASLAQRISGCGFITASTPPVIAEQDVTCLMPDGEQLEVVTFASSASEGQWISDGGSPSTPDPAYLGCCVQGNGWAADVSATGPVGSYDFGPVVKALGGRQVSG